LGCAQTCRQISRRDALCASGETPRTECGARQHNGAADPHGCTDGREYDADLRRERHRA
jgi:hypothetical protein